MRNSVVCDLLDGMNHYAIKAMDKNNSPRFRKESACKAYGMALVLSCEVKYCSPEYDQVERVMKMYYGMMDIE